MTTHGLPKVLVLMAAYNGAPWLQEQLKSILSQVEVELAVCARDDVSTDATLVILREAAHADARVRVSAGILPSGSAAANFLQLIMHANAEDFDYIAFADQDDIWHPRKLISAIELLGSHDASGYSCSVEPFSQAGLGGVICQESKLRAADFLFEGAGQGCTFVLKKDFFLRTQDFCRTNNAIAAKLQFHDWLVYILSRCWGLQWHFDCRPWIRYRQHESNSIGSRGSLKSVWRRAKMVRDGWYRDQITAAVGVALAAGSKGLIVQQCSILLNLPKSCGRKIQLTIFVLRHGRRRIADRVAMAIFVALGWL